MKKILTIIISLLCLTVTGQTTSTLFDFGWRFIEGDVAEATQPAFDDSQWQGVNLPHDWDIYHAPAADAPMGNDGGYYPGGIGWYRKTFATPAGEQVRLHFEGVYQKSTIYVNGQVAGTHGYGYTPFTIDITPYLYKGKKQKNIVAVRVDNTLQPNCRWYSGSGIYRHVWLQISGSLRIAENGVFVTTPEVSASKATVKVEVTVENASDKERKVDVAVGDDSQSVTVAANTTKTISTSFAVTNPKLWSPDSPMLYKVNVAVREGGTLVDSKAVKYGIRYFSFDAKNGFMLNGKKVQLNGACVHHDDGILGAMAFDQAEIRKVRQMKEAGFNLIRTSHNPTTQVFLDACDSLGMLVISEAFDNWYRSKTKGDYSTLIDSCWQEDISALVLRDRNHPAVICWSIGNEVIERRDISVVTTARKFKTLVNSLDPTRPVTEALCSWAKGDNEWQYFDPHAEVLDIVGYNYMIHHHTADHQRDPQRVMWQTESYPRDAFRNWQNVVTYPYIVADIVWTGLDYMGESGIGRFYYKGESEGEHYKRPHFPWHGAYCGDVDVTGWRKPISHYRDMLYNQPEGTGQLYIAVKEPDGYKGQIRETLWSVWPTWESWNWPGWEGKTIEVEVYTKSPSVKLYLDDKLVGEKAVSAKTQYKAVFPMPYQRGTLRAVSADGTAVTLATTGEAVSLRLTPDRRVLTADGQDLAFIIAEAVDSEGRVVPNAAVPFDVKVSGAATLLAAASADLKDLEPTVSSHVTTYCGRAMIVVRSAQKGGRVTVETKSQQLPTPASKLTLTAK